MSGQESCVPGSIYAAIIFNVLCSCGICGLNGYIIFVMVYKKHLQIEMAKCASHFTEAIKGVEFSRMPAAAVAVIAEIGGVPLAEVIKAYEKDSMERRAIVYSVMGKTRLAQRFVDDFQSKFMVSGYENEELFLKN